MKINSSINSLIGSSGLPKQAQSEKSSGSRQRPFGDFIEEKANSQRNFGNQSSRVDSKKDQGDLRTNFSESKKSRGANSQSDHEPNLHKDSVGSTQSNASGSLEYPANQARPGQSDAVGNSSLPTNQLGPLSRPQSTGTLSQPSQSPMGSTEDVVGEKIKESILAAQSEVQGEYVDSLNDRLALQVFISKMKDEVGVDPQQILEAFSALELTDLAKPPIENVEKIVENLQLSAEKQVLAKRLFHDMIKQSAAQNMADYLKTSDRQISLSVISQNELNQRMREQSVQKMSDQFFVDPQSLARKQQNEMRGQALPLGAGVSMTGQNGAALTSQNSYQMAGPSAHPGSSAPSVSESLSQYQMQGSPQAHHNQGGQNQNSKGIDLAALAALMPAASVKNNSNSKNSVNPQALQLKSQMPNFSSSSEAAGIDPGGESNMFSSLGFDGLSMSENSQASQRVDQVSGQEASDFSQMDHSNMESTEGEFFETQGLSSNQTAEGLKGSQGLKPAMSFGVGASAMSDSQEASNIQEVINKAQFMIKKGGGEMRVNLQPEGMGEVALKVKSNQGQINVEMITETSEAKKLIEKGVGELKATLASQKLNVDNIRVETASEIAKDFENQQERSDKQFARQFMQEFRQDNQSWRRGLFDIPGARHYSSQTEDEADNSYITQSQSTKSSSNGRRRLDLVA